MLTKNTRQCDECGKHIPVYAPTCVYCEANRERCHLCGVEHNLTMRSNYSICLDCVRDINEHLGKDASSE